MTRLNKMFVGGVDARSAKGHKYKELYDGIMAQLGDAAKDNPVKQSLVRRLISTMLMSGEIERDFIEGRPVDRDKANRLTNTERGLCKELGLLPQQGTKATPTASKVVTEPKGVDGEYTAEQIAELESEHPCEYSKDFTPIRDGAGYHFDPDGVLRDLNDRTFDDHMDYEAVNGHFGSYDDTYEQVQARAEDRRNGGDGRIYEGERDG